MYYIVMRKLYKEKLAHCSNKLILPSTLNKISYPKLLEDLD